MDLRYDALIGHAPEGPWARLAPLRILSFDIECCGRKGTFPEPEVDPVIQIANCVTPYGAAAPAVRVRAHGRVRARQGGRAGIEVPVGGRPSERQAGLLALRP